MCQLETTRQIWQDPHTWQDPLKVTLLLSCLLYPRAQATLQNPDEKPLKDTCMYLCIHVQDAWHLKFYLKLLSFTDRVPEAIN